MTRLDPIFALPSEPRKYLESLEFLRVQIADYESSLEEHEAAARQARIEIPQLERQAAEHERDAANSKLKLLELKGQLAKRLLFYE